MLGAGFGRTGGANCDDRHHASQEKYLHGSHAQQTSEGRGLFQLPIDAPGAGLGFVKARRRGNGGANSRAPVAMIRLSFRGYPRF